MGSAELAVVKDETREVHHMKSSRLDDSLFSKDLAPHYMQLATKLASSELVPKCFRGKAPDLFICWSMGYQIGMSPEQAMQCIAVVNGKAVMWGDEMLALCMSHPDFEDIDEQPILAKDGSVFGYTCTVKRKGRAPKVNKFDLNDAKKAGLLGKVGPWTQYPERMLKLRARSFTLRDSFPDALKGIKPREEVEDYIDGEYEVIQDKSLSRTELLKKDYLHKTGKLNAESVAQPMDSVSSPEDTFGSDQDVQRNEVEETGEEKIDLHSEIKRLLAERQFTEEKLAKALKYYEVDTIEALPDDYAQHFINQLNKL